MSVNKVIILGRLGGDPELNYTPNGNAVCNFSLATTEAWNDKATGEKQEKTEWHRVVVFGKLAELSNQYLSKGRQAFVEGKLQTRSWEDKDGNKRYTTEAVAQTVQFIGGKSDNPNQVNSDKNQALQTAIQKADNKEYSVSTDTNFASEEIPF